MLLFDEDERKPPEDFLLQFEAFSKLDPQEKQIIKEVLDGLILKHEAKRWAAASQLSFGFLQRLEFYYE